ncbi:hypothetical protein FSHL1_002863 [Fusarium sambucinum]
MTSVNVRGGTTGLVAQSVTAGTLNFVLGAESAFHVGYQQACAEWIRNSGSVNVDGVLEAIKASRQRVAGTCQWYKQREEYQDWLRENERKRLWMSADPGAGKTTTLTAIIDELQQSSRNDCSSIVLFFFFDDKIENQSSATDAVLSLIGQLLKQQPQLFGHVRDMSKTDLESLPNLWGCLRKMIDALSQNAYIFLDALDECSPSQVDDLLKHLSDEASPLKAKILVSSRSHLTKPQSYNDLQIQLDDIKDDIVKVIDARMKGLIDYPLELREQIKRRLYYATGRTFLWVSLLIEYLKTEPPDQFYSRAGSSYVTEDSLLKLMPAKLSEVYDKILNKISSAHGSRRMRFILYCVVAARRPLTRKELAMCYCLGWKVKECNSIPDPTYLACHENIWTRCKPMLVHDDKTDTINLVHQTAKDYLLNSHLMRVWTISDFWQSDLLSTSWICNARTALLSQASLQRFPLNILSVFARRILMYLDVLVACFRTETNSNQANRLMFQICWRYLGMTNIHKDQQTSNDGVGTNPALVRYRDRCLYEYAFTEWQHHFLGLDQISTYLLFPSLVEIPSSNKKLVHAAASDGKADVLQLFIKAGTDVTEPDETGSTALDKAIRSNELESALTLFRAGCSIDSQPTMSIIQWTSSHHALARLFFYHFVIFEEDGLWITSFQFTQKREPDRYWIEVVSALLGLEVTAKMKDFNGLTALHWATMLSSSEVVSITFADKGNKFQMVRNVMSEGIAQIAINKNIRADVKDKFGLTAVHWAAILSSGGKVHLAYQQNGAMEKYLEVDSTNGDDTVAKLLATKGAELVAQDSFGFTALHWLALLCSTTHSNIWLEKDTVIRVNLISEFKPNIVVPGLEANFVFGI